MYSPANCSVTIGHSVIALELTWHQAEREQLIQADTQQHIATPSSKYKHLLVS